MTMTLKQREAREKDIHNPESNPLVKREHSKIVTYSELALLASIIITHG